MKKCCYLFLLSFFLVVVASCDKEDDDMDSLLSKQSSPFVTPNSCGIDEVLKRDTLRILDIGNSYTNDGIAYLGHIVEAANINTDNICFYSLTRGSASFKSWYDCYSGLDNQKYHLNKEFGGLTMQVKPGVYGNGDSSGMQSALSQKWDLIIVHQVSDYANDYRKWNTMSDGGYLYRYTKMLSALQPDAAFGFLLIHSYMDNYKSNTEGSSFKRWNNIVKATDEMLVDYPIYQLVIPYGSAIENLRSSSLNNEYDLTRDGTHLGYGLARYAAACAYYQSIFYPRTGVSVLGNTWRYQCTSSELKKVKYLSSCVDVDDDAAHVAQMAAVYACQNYRNNVAPTSIATQ